MKHKKLRGVVAMLLTLVMVVGLLPTSVYAADADGGGNSVVIESVSDPVTVFDKGIIINHNKNRANLH